MRASKMTEAELRERLEVVWSRGNTGGVSELLRAEARSIRGGLRRILGKRPCRLVMDYGVQNYIEDEMVRIGDLIICRVVLPAVFDTDACRFTSDLELQFNEYVLDFDGCWQVHEYALGEFPTGEVRHLLQLRSYKRLWMLPQELVGGIIGYIAGDIRAFYGNLLAILEQYTSWDICLGLREDGWDDIESIKQADVMIERLATYIMIYDALVATLPMPFA